jgi:hypothetical protein
VKSNELPWPPAALRLDQAAAYCGLSIDLFKEKCPVKPIEFTVSTRGHRYRRAALDEWLASIDPNVQTAPKPTRIWGDKIGAKSEPARP